MVQVLTSTLNGKKSPRLVKQLTVFATDNGG